MIRIIYSSVLLLAVLSAAMAHPGLAREPAPGGPPAVAGEQEITEGVRSGRLGRDQLIAKGRELSYFEKLRLYYYAQELEPYFQGVEEAIRDLARTPPQQLDDIAAARRALYRAMERARARLAAAHRPGLEVEWHRGLTGLVYLDYDWRDRVAEQKKDEIKNPYDLVALLDCLDARLRGLTRHDLDACPARAGSSGKKQP